MPDIGVGPALGHAGHHWQNGLLAVERLDSLFSSTLSTSARWGARDIARRCRRLYRRTADRSSSCTPSSIATALLGMPSAHRKMILRHRSDIDRATRRDTPAAQGTPAHLNSAPPRRRPPPATLTMPRPLKPWSAHPETYFGSMTSEPTLGRCRGSAPSANDLRFFGTREQRASNTAARPRA
jgi:hypothetical protein